MALAKYEKLMRNSWARPDKTEMRPYKFTQKPAFDSQQAHKIRSTHTKSALGRVMDRAKVAVPNEGAHAPRQAGQNPPSARPRIPG